MLTTTLNKILEHNPCGQDDDTNGFGLGLLNAKKSGIGLDGPITLMQILKSNGIEDAIWVLRCFDYKEYCLFLADVAESVLLIYESKYDSPEPRLAIKGIRDYHAGKITQLELVELADAAGYAAGYAVGYAAAAGCAAAGCAGYAGVAGVAGVASVDETAVFVIAVTIEAAVRAGTAHSAKLCEIEEVFIKHFCQKEID